MDYKEDVLNFIDILTGVDIHHDNENDTIRMHKGLKDLNRKIFSRGDCGRLATILYYVYKNKYKDVHIVRLYKEGWKHNQYHYVTKIYDTYFDVFGEINVSSFKDVYVLSPDDFTTYKHELNGNYSIMRLLGEIVYCNAIPINGIVINRNDLYERNIKHTDSKTADDICNHEIRLMILIFNKVFHNKKLTLKEMYNELNLIYDTQLYKYNWLVTMRNNLKASVGGMEND